MLRYSTGCVEDYATCGVTPDLPATIPEGENFRFWYNLGGFQLVSAWNNGDVWGSDFRDGTDEDPGGGSDLPDIYLFAGHGSYQNPPTATSLDFLFTCGN